jgi:hypothetical protein
VVSAELLRDALLAKTRSALQLGGTTGGVGDVDWWSEAERALDDLDALQRRDQTLEINRGTVAVLRAQIDARYGNAGDALKRLEEVRPTMTSPADRMELAVALGGVFATREEPEAIDHLAEAIKLAEDDPGIAPRQLLELRQLLAAHCTLHDRYDLAAEQLLLVRARLRRASIERCQVTARLAATWLASDEPRQALGAVRNALYRVRVRTGGAAERRAGRGARPVAGDARRARGPRGSSACGGWRPRARARAVGRRTRDGERALGTAAREFRCRDARGRRAGARAIRAWWCAVRDGPTRRGARRARDRATAVGAEREARRAERQDLHEKVLLLLYRVGNLKMASST